MQINQLLLMGYVSYVLGIEKCLHTKKYLRYYKIKSCYKSTLPILSWRNFYNVSDCMKYAREKNGLAFNFSPPQLNNLTADKWFKNCQVLGCPEIKNSTTLIFDAAFDYYTTYGDLNDTVSATCFKSVGLYKLIEAKKNYHEAIGHCQNLGGDLADVLSEFKTNSLALLIKSLKNWYKAVYVGLDDIETEGIFKNPMGDYMECDTFRAWGVGHPRPGRKREDCVILSAERTWRAINCKIKMPFICEYYPTQPPAPLFSITKKNCSKIKNRSKKKQCVANNELYKLYTNSARIDQCALFNDFE